MTSPEARHAVLIAGSAVSGAEVAFQLARSNVLCVVIDQSNHPYGKIVDGLPRWHEKLRLQEMHKIDEKLAHPLVHFVPQTRLGRDVSLDEALGWGLSAMVLANGAWRDRPLPVPGIGAYEGRGFFYQNAFVHWFNHYEEPGYQGPHIEPSDGALIVGGGLASLDVVKILMLETIARTLRGRGIHVGLYELEQRGIAAVLTQHGLSLSGLGLKGCTLFYRRRAEDMPLAEPKDPGSAQQLDQARATRLKLLRLFMEKYMFTYHERLGPIGFEAQDGCISGLRMVETRADGNGSATADTSERFFPSPMIVSSIGSIPEPVPGIPMAGEQYRFKDAGTGELDGLPGVFAVGNAVTGKGNILVSARHGRTVSQHMIEHYLLGTGSGYEEVLADAAVEAESKASAINRRLAGQTPLSGAQVAAVLERVRALQQRAGYPGDYRAWLDLEKPARP